MPCGQRRLHGGTTAQRRSVSLCADCAGGRRARAGLGSAQRRRRLRIATFAGAPAALAVPAMVQAGPFQSPSGNIGCYINKAAVRCDIREREWKPPKKPASCELDWGYGLSIARKGRGAVVCAGDTALGAGPMIAYGGTVSRGRFTCRSLTTGVR